MSSKTNTSPVKKYKYMVNQRYAEGGYHITKWKNCDTMKEVCDTVNDMVGHNVCGIYNIKQLFCPSKLIQKPSLLKRCFPNVEVSRIELDPRGLPTGKIEYDQSGLPKNPEEENYPA